MCSTNSDRSICTCKIDLSGCVVCVVQIQIDLSVRVRSIWVCSMCSTNSDRSICTCKIDLSGCVVCLVQIQIDLSVRVR